MRMRRHRLVPGRVLLMAVKDDACARVARAFAALANPARLKILDALVANCCAPRRGCACSVCEINAKVALPQPSVSKHLKILKNAGILDFERDGNRILYSFKNGALFEEIAGLLAQYGGCCGKKP
jgi:DNA-binding transcriptional ArsR family regulator